MNKYEVTAVHRDGISDYSEIIEAESYSPNGDYIEFYVSPQGTNFRPDIRGSNGEGKPERVASYLQPLKVRKLQGEIRDEHAQEVIEAGTKSHLRDHIYGQYVSAHLRSDVNPRWCVNESDLGTIRSLTTEDGQPMWAPASKLGEPDTLLGYPIKVSRDFFVDAPTLT